MAFLLSSRNHRFGCKHRRSWGQLCMICSLLADVWSHNRRWLTDHHDRLRRKTKLVKIHLRDKLTHVLRHHQFLLLVVSKTLRTREKIEWYRVILGFVVAWEISRLYSLLLSRSQAPYDPYVCWLGRQRQIWQKQSWKLEWFGINMRWIFEKKYETYSQ